MRINPNIFREYDIRGRVDQKDELTPEAIDAIGRGFATFLKRRGIHAAVVGHDARPYSKSVNDITVKALLESGIDVIEIGTVLAPIFYFAQYHLQKKGGVMITASHNPWGWSGFKHAYDYSTTLVPNDMQELQKIVEENEFIKGKGKYEVYKDIIEKYKEDTLNRIRIARPLRVLIDTGNGTAGPIVPDILRKAGCIVVEQYTEVSEIRHHEANPSTLGMLDAMSVGVKTHHADIGLGFDDDGDRLGAVDEKGQIIWPDQILLLLARPIIAKNPGAKVVFDIKCTEALVEDIKARGGIPIMWKTGHSYIKAKAKEEGAFLAGERSGHMYFLKEHYEFDDAIFAGLKLLEYISNQQLKSFSEIIAELPHYITSPVWHAPCDDTKKYQVTDKLTTKFKQEYGHEHVIDINGARVYMEDGWGLVRASSNVPALVLVFEAKTKEGLKKIESIFREKLTAFPEVGKDWVSG
ncbi:MAG: phosphomannomutase/phosphoglucomutase [Candidatus Sungbacteria bacterium]|nr:phosphomannomutase/phosphoglucomutase [Candidatus Sungbacteria bacterium]